MTRQVATELYRSWFGMLDIVKLVKKEVWELSAFALNQTEILRKGKVHKTSGTA